MERETHEIVTPEEGIKVVLKSWITGREKRAINSVYLKSVNISANNPEGGEGDYEISGSVVQESQDAAINAIVDSVNGSKENVLDAILDMKAKDTEFVIEEVQKVAGGLEEETKKK